MTKFRVLLVLYFLGAALHPYAQIGGTTVFSSLNIYGSARIAALGGNSISIKDSDINLVAANPALIDSSMNGHLALSYVNYFEGINFGYAAYARNLGSKKLTMAATFQYINYGQMTELDGLGNEIGQFNAGDYTLITGMAYRMDSLWTLGANWKNVYSSLAGFTSYATAIDLGAVYHKAAKNFTAAFVLRNAGIQLVSFNDSVREKLPVELQMAFTKRPRHAPFRFSVIVENLQRWNLQYDDPNARIVTDPVTGEVIEDNRWVFGDNLMRHIVFGTEFLLSENFHIRFGYNYRRRQELQMPDKPATAGMSFGVGMNVKRFNISYGRAIYHAAGPSHHLSISTRLHG